MKRFLLAHIGTCLVSEQHRTRNPGSMVWNHDQVIELYPESCYCTLKLIDIMRSTLCGCNIVCTLTQFQCTGFHKCVGGVTLMHVVMFEFKYCCNRHVSFSLDKTQGMRSKSVDMCDPRPLTDSGERAGTNPFSQAQDDTRYMPEVHAAHEGLLTGTAASGQAASHNSAGILNQHQPQHQIAPKSSRTMTTEPYFTSRSSPGLKPQSPYAIVDTPSIHCDNDMLVVYAIPTGHFAWRNSMDGSWMIYYLHKVLMAYDFKKPKNFLSLLTMVNAQMSQRTTNAPHNKTLHEKKAVSVIEHKLTRDVIFQQKVEMSHWKKQVYL